MEDRYDPEVCCAICCTPLKIGEYNDPWPYLPRPKAKTKVGSVCDKCNREIVVPARINKERAKMRFNATHNGRI